MKKILILTLAASILIINATISASESVEQFAAYGLYAKGGAEHQEKLDKKLEKIIKNQEEIKALQKEILVHAKMPREQHTHYGFLSPHPLTALIMVGVPSAAAVLILALMKS